jgi:cytochrome c peroxidase
MKHLVSFFAVVACAIGTASQAVQAQDAPPEPFGLKPVKWPDDNKPTVAKIELGKQLFFDSRLSKDNTISCASCHDPKKGFSNGSAFATGVGGAVGGRSAPTVINAAYYLQQFWDGRAPSLEAQALGPIENPIEMAISVEDVVAKLNKIEGYKSQFQSVFGTDVTRDGLAKSIAAYERTVLSGNAPFDRFKAGDKKAMSAAAQRGWAVFKGKGHCTACHVSHSFTDRSYHNIGIGMDAKVPDVGREKVSKLEGDRGAFKTPTLREIARTAPYMHDGRFKTLEEVVEHYATGGIANEYLDEEIYEFKLKPEEKKDLVIFLKEGLSSPDYPDHKAPKLPK